MARHLQDSKTLSPPPTHRKRRKMGLGRRYDERQAQSLDAATPILPGETPESVQVQRSPMPATKQARILAALQARQMPKLRTQKPTDLHTVPVAREFVLTLATKTMREISDACDALPESQADLFRSMTNWDQAGSLQGKPGHEISTPHDERGRPGAPAYDLIEHTRQGYSLLKAMLALGPQGLRGGRSIAGMVRGVSTWPEVRGLHTPGDLPRLPD